MKLPVLVREGHGFPEPVIPERMVWTSSSARLFDRCKRKFFWKYIFRIRPRFRDKNLIIGGAAHESLAQWYRGNKSSMGKIASRYASQMEDEVKLNHSYYSQEDLDKLTTTIDTFTGMMMGYEEIYKKDRAHWDIERKSIEAKFKMDLGKFDVAGKIDLVTRIKKRNRGKVVEHKTKSKIGESQIDRLQLDTQIRTYVLGCGELYRTGVISVPVTEVLYDIIRKCSLRRKSNETMDEFTTRIHNDYMVRPEFYFFREDLLFNKTDIEAVVWEYKQRHREYEDLIERYRDIKPKLFEARSWRPNDSECDAFFRTCEYHSLCTTGLDKATAKGYDWSEDLHEELADED